MMALRPSPFVPPKFVPKQPRIPELLTYKGVFPDSYWDKWPINPLKDTPDPWIKPSKLWDVGLSSGYPNVPELAHICSWLSNGAPVGARGAARLPAHGSNLKGMEIHGYEGNYYNMNYPFLIVFSLTIIICWVWYGTIFPFKIFANIKLCGFNGADLCLFIKQSL